MRMVIKNTSCVKPKLEYLQSILEPLGYRIDKFNTTDTELFLRNNEYHLRVTPKKTKINFRLHKDRFVFGRHGSDIAREEDIKKELNRVKKTLEDHFKN